MEFLKAIKGVGIYLMINRERVVIHDGNGYVGELNEADTVVIGAMTKREAIVGLAVDGQKNCELRKNLAAELKYDLDELRVWRQKVEIKFGEKTGVWHSQYPANHIRLLEFNPDNQWRCRMWEITLLSQGGKFFIAVQDTYGWFGVYRDGSGKIVLPRFPKWPQLNTLVSDLLLEQVDDLPSISEYQAPNSTKTPLPGEDTGKVLWWNAAQGFGAVYVGKASKNGVARVHWNEVPVRKNGMVYLEEGETIRFQTTVDPRQTNSRETTFVSEVVGVELVA